MILKDAKEMLLELTAFLGQTLPEGRDDRERVALVAKRSKLLWRASEVVDKLCTRIEELEKHNESLVEQLPIDFHAAAGYVGVRRLLVCGSRTVRRVHLPLIRAELVCVPKNTVVVHGGQGIWDRRNRSCLEWKVISGADLLAAEVAFELGLTVEEHPARWKTPDGIDRGAGFRRNLEMLESGVDYVLAFWDGSSPGTAHTLREARKRGITCRVVGI